MPDLTMNDADPHRHKSKVKQVGFFQKDNITISTAYNASTGHFDTVIVHPYYENEIIILEKYENLVIAESGHRHWVGRAIAGILPPKRALEVITGVKPTEKQKKQFKISLAALIRILSPLSDVGNQLKIQTISAKPGYLILTIIQGQFRGALAYDSINQVAKEVTATWTNLIQKSIDYVTEKYIINDVNEEEEMAAEQKQAESLAQMAGIGQDGIPY